MKNLNVELGDCVIVKEHTGHHLAGDFAYVAELGNNKWGEVIYTLIGANLDEHKADINDIEGVYEDDLTYTLKQSIFGDEDVLCNGVGFKKCIQYIFSHKLHKAESYNGRFCKGGELSIFREQDGEEVYNIAIL